MDPSTVTCNAEKVAPAAKDIFSLKVRINLLPSFEISEVVNVGFVLTTGGLESSQTGGLSTSICAMVGLFFEQFPEISQATTSNTYEVSTDKFVTLNL